MTILIATDSFKDALPALEVCRAIERGLRQAGRDVRTVVFPLADGGEGTAGILTFHNNGQTVEREVNDPLFRPVKASYGLSADGATAYIDMAEASGLQLLKSDGRNPLLTSTYGTGELILDAVQRGARRLLLGIGGSATNDAGMGMAAALGYRFLDEAGRELSPTGQSLERVRRIDDGQLKIDSSRLEVTVLCDVDNPLFGPRGAAHVYAPQKGADAETVERLDEGLRSFAQVLQEHFQRAVAAEPGAGAAGGMGAGALAFLGAELRPGIETVIEHTGFEKALEGADLLLTGEGRLDGQTLHGKLIHGLCRRAARHRIPVIALCGALEATPGDLEEIGLIAAFSILPRPMSLEEALRETETLLEQTAHSVLRTLLAGAGRAKQR
jgi:glycerate kinase